jgi:hypothetical protein
MITIVDESFLKYSLYFETYLGAQNRTFTLRRIENRSADHQTVTSQYDCFHNVPGVRSASLRWRHESQQLALSCGAYISIQRGGNDSTEYRCVICNIIIT